jgi:hypothetical protein
VRALDNLKDFLQPGDASPSRTTLPVGVPVFVVVGLNQINRGDDILSIAKPAGWRFLVSTDFGQPIAADVTTRAGAAPKMTSVWRGSPIQQVVSAKDTIKRLDQVQTGNYELRILRLPELRIEAYWLKSLTNDRDLVVPVLTLAKELNPLQPYPVDKFRQIVSDLSAKEFPDKTKPRR